ncbi:nucleotide sugar dehydrogenase [Candidatus Acetothermia bacterium]|nr:nucleotide sugar dehydrogenase [Candidatus Acetothermia bacterium]MBI3643994.1 nucleotide sugar dehydrogenase [Candidatus Acetothermia bacterium]
MDRELLVVVGLGYVGLPLATAFGQTRTTIGYDINAERVKELQQSFDRNEETSSEELRALHLSYTNDPAVIQDADVVIVAVPSPVDAANQPDLAPLVSASATVGKHLKRGAIVVYESTVFPGCTEEVCQPVLERESGLKAGRDFFVGYSPERINPGDREHTLSTITKVVSAQDAKTAERLAKLYGEVVLAGTYTAPNIRTAEAAKVIENIQRDLNIALMNELALIFHRLAIDTREVLKASRTKWNFLPFEPGLVGGHCIPVDPYYLTHKAETIGYHPQVILAGRQINNSMAPYVAQETIRLLARAGKSIQKSKILVLGVAFKENVNDLRSTRVVDLIEELRRFDAHVVVHDPLIETKRLMKLGLQVVEDPFSTKEKYDAVILAVPHQVLLDQKPEAFIGLLNMGSEKSAVLVDVKGVLHKEELEKTRGLLFWRL